MGQQWKPNNQDMNPVTMMLPTHDGQRIQTTMTEWHWEALRWICTITRDNEKYKDLIEFALRGVFEWNVSWDKAMMEVTHRWFDHYRSK